MNRKGWALGLAAISLFIPPLVLCGAWYSVEYQEFNPFLGHVVGGRVLTLNSEKDLQAIPRMLEGLYNYQRSLPESQSNFQQIGQQKEKIYPNGFREEVSKIFGEKLGVIAKIPYHNVCLKNRNRSTDEIDGAPVNSEVANSQIPPPGALSIIQVNGYSFYALPGDEDCKLVNVVQFKTSTTTVETGYQVITRISNAEQLKLQKGKPFDIVVATSTISVEESKVVISLTWWELLLAYPALLIAWSVVFFQIIKIIEYLESFFEKKVS